MADSVELFVPGRLCLFGEHSDWAGTAKSINADIVPGCAIVTGIEQGIYGTAVKSSDFTVKSDLKEYNGESFTCPMEIDKLKLQAKEGGFFSYVAGVASYMCEWYHVGGIELTINRMDLPMKGGLSSSAAICVMVAKAFNQLYSLQLNTLGIMNIAYWGEQRTPSRCGRLDQACAFGTRPVKMIFDGYELSVDRIAVKKTLHYVIADLCAGKDTVKILADLNRAYPFAHNEAEGHLQEALGTDNAVITARAAEYISSGEVQKLGELMCEAQRLFDEKVQPMCPDELKSPVLHSVLDDENVKRLTVGAKGVGSQGDGSVQMLCKDAASQKELFDYIQNERKMKPFMLTLRPTKSIRKAVIPVAGFGTRLYPTTRGVKKEFCPVVDADGLMKPGILVLLEELDRIDIDEICLILNEEEQQYYEEFFFSPLSEQHFEKLTPKMKEYEKKIARIAKKLKFVYQKEQRGFGHAVSLAKDFANGESVLLLLGDTIYESNTNVPCTQQLIEAYEKYDLPMVAVSSVPLEDVGNYGIFAGTFEDREKSVLKLSKIEEKPTIDWASEYLEVEGKYYAAFGAYILTDAIFNRLDMAVKDNIVNDKGEIELTEALSYVCKNESMMAFVPCGQSYDLGNPKAYRDTVSRFGAQKQ